MSTFPIISLLTLTPLVGAILLWIRGERQPSSSVNRIGFAFSGAAFLLTVILALRFDISSGEFQAVERYGWIPTLNLDYLVGVDGLSLLMVILTTLLIPLSLCTGNTLQHHRHHYVALVLLLETGLIGTFTTMTFFHWFLFWEISLIPAFFLVRVWGGPERQAASLQFFVYTFVGSIGLLLSFLALFAATGTFEFSVLAAHARDGSLLQSVAANIKWVDIPIRWIGLILFGLAFLGVAVKVPIYPFHTWLPNTYTQAPTPVTIVLTGLMSKMGVYALLRLILPVFRDQMHLVATPLLWLAVATIVLSAFAAYRQTDLKRIFAYSSINHLGYCFLGVFAIVAAPQLDLQWQGESSAALNGVILQLFNHGIIAGLIFYLVGRLETRTDGKRDLNEFGGLRSVAPIFTTTFGIALFASLGLPGLSAFVGEFLIFKGAFGLVKWAPAIASMGLLMTAVFLLGILQKVWMGPLNSKWDGFADLTADEKRIVYPAVALILIAGILPQILIRFFNQSTIAFLSQLGGLQ